MHTIANFGRKLKRKIGNFLRPFRFPSFNWFSKWSGRFKPNGRVNNGITTINSPPRIPHSPPRPIPHSPPKIPNPGAYAIPTVAAKDIAEEVGSRIKEGGNTLGDAAREVIHGVKDGVIHAGNTVKTGADKVVGGVNTVVGGVARAGEGIKNVGKSVFDGLFGRRK